MVTRVYSRPFYFQLLDLFGDATLCSRAADGFSVVLEDSDILNQKNHSISRVRSHGPAQLCVCSSFAVFVQLMHKQQFCVEVVPELVSQFNSAAPGI